MKFGDVTGLGGAKLIASESDVEFDAESMVAPPEAPSRGVQISETTVELHLRHNQDEMKIIGFLKGAEAGLDSLGLLIQALLSVALEGCSMTLTKPMSLEKVIFTSPNKEGMEWKSAKGYQLQNFSIREVIGKSAVVGLSFKSPI
jgi:hypothetical protein